MKRLSRLGREGAKAIKFPHHVNHLARLLGLISVIGLIAASPSVAKPTTQTSEWAQQSPATSPTARRFASMADDPAIGKIVLFGGESSAGRLNDTWTYDGSEWTRQSPATHPPARRSAAMAYDPAIGKVVLFGGVGEGGEFGLLGDTWTYDGTEWTQQSPATHPPVRNGASMAYDPAIGKIVLFGGEGVTSLLDDTWTYDGSEWTQQSPAAEPPVRTAASMAYDPEIGEMVLFGGAGELPVLGDTWIYDGTDWTQQSPAASPVARRAASMDYDAATGQIVLFGGFSEEGASGDTWTYDGSTWTQQSPTTSPPARFFASMDYDPAIGKTILFGGAGSGGPSLEDTWAYQRLTPPTATISSPAGGQSYVIGASVPTSFSCAESAGGPGIKSCTDSNGVGSGTGRLDTSSVGEHTYSVTAVSEDGEEGRAQVTYTVTKAPSTTSIGAVTTPSVPPRPSVRILYSPNHPHAANPNGGPRYTFHFTDAVPGTTFYCRLDQGSFKPCSPPKVYRNLRKGRHRFAVKSVDAAGVASPVEKVTFYAGRRRQG